jgi:hypothetical protein
MARYNSKVGARPALPLRHGGFNKVPSRRRVFLAASTPIWVRTPEIHPAKVCPPKSVEIMKQNASYASHGLKTDRGTSPPFGQSITNLRLHRKSNPRSSGLHLSASTSCTTACRCRSVDGRDSSWATINFFWKLTLVCGTGLWRSKVFSLSQLNAVHMLTLGFLKIHLNFSLISTCWHS